jgi:NADPH-dependent curcumin reductase CurA
MSLKTEEKILKKLERIEGLLIQIIPQRTELTEEDVLRIVKEGDKEYREGKTEDLESFLKREFPQYASKD